MSHIGQAHLRTTLRPRFLTLAVLAGTLVASLTAVSTAGAADVTVSECSQLQHVLKSAEPGDVITLAALCTKTNSGEAEGSFRLPSVANLTIEGQGTTAGFDGTEVSGSALEGTGNGVVLRNLVVENYSLNEESAVTLNSNEGALPRIESDHFIDDTNSTSNNSNRGGALYISASNGTCAYTAPLSITDSLFKGDHIADTSTTENNRDMGGAAYAEIRCNPPSAPIDFAILDGNTFVEDGIGTTGGREALGGGLFLGNSSPETLVSATQSGNIFEADTISSPTPTAVYGGGGEWAPSIDLTSTGDRFVKNSLPGPQGMNASSQGAGLGVTSAACSKEVTPSVVLNNAVFAANTIGPASEDGESAGAGIYAACESNEPNSHFHLTLDDSTVAGNQAPGGVAGVDGEDTDQLALANSIVRSPTGQADIGGFRTTEGGSLASSFSDACTPGVSTNTPLPGEGNICAGPSLVSEETGDVQETASSPTIDAGSNALVPAGLTTDAFGDPRILPGHAGCSQGFPAVVDMGAGEFIAPEPSCPPPVGPRPPVPGLTHYIGRKLTSTGIALTLSCVSTDGLGCSGTIFLTSNETLQGKKVLAVTASHRTRASVRLGQASFALAAGATATFTVKLNSTGRALLRRFHAISAFLLANEASPTSTPFIFLLDGVRFSQPQKHGSKKHKLRHAKPRH